MAFTNLPPNLQDMFYNLQDQINKLVTGPNQAMYTAESAQGSAQYAYQAAQDAQSVATQAQIQAINAGVQANYALSQATIAQSQATIASTQATQAQVTANGKNKVYYSTSTPGTTANTVGDIWYQYGTTGTYANKVIAQWTGAGGTSWTSVTVSGLVLANLDAGSITTGTLSAIQISAGSGSQVFTVSSTGYLSAQGAYIKGNITADSGTFTGDIRANAGYFGTGSGGTLINGWSIGSTGLTGVGTGTITGGAINGSTITGGTIQTSAGSTAVKMVGSTNTLDFIVGGSTVGQIYPLSTGGISFQYGTSLSNAYMYLDSTTAFLRGNASNSLSVSNTGISIGGTSTIINGSSSLSFNSSNTSISANFYSPTHINNAYLYVDYTIGAAGTTAATNCYISTSGQILKTSTTSSIRYKENITDISNVPELDPKLLLQIPVKAFSYINGHIVETDDRVNQMLPGFIAEDVDAIYPIAADYADGNVETWSERYIIPGLLALIQDQEKRIQILEGK